MIRRTFGSTGLSVSPIGMGTIQITRLEWKESIRVIRKVMEMGINWFDTARSYLDSELRLGEALKGVRERVIIITKSGKKTSAELEQQINESLQRLKTDYLDIFLFHGGEALEEESFAQAGGLLETAQRAVKAGKIRFLGLSAHHPDQALKGLEYESMQAGMVPANFISREYIDGAFMKRAREKNMAVMAMKPFGGGRIGNAQVCLKFLKSYPDLFPCIGIERPEEMEQNLAVWEDGQGLTEADREELRRLTGLLGNRFCRSCGYCLPCPQEIPIPTVTFLKVFARQMPPHEVWTEEHRKAVERARECTECGQCVERCPYSLEIPEMLRENVRFYEESTSR
ncbi:hypothetical protein ES703_68958 [subsurface metagenome]